MDKKGIGLYLGITLVLSCAVEILTSYLRALEIGALVLFAVPAVAAWIAGRLSPRPEFAAGALWPIPFIRALRISCAIYLVFAVVFLITTIAGFTSPDWGVGELLARIPSYDQIQVPDHLRPMLPTAFLLFTLALMFVIPPTIYAVLLLGPAYGWCGYLLPRLMPLGRWTAYGVVGLTAGLSIMPGILLASTDWWLAVVFQTLAYTVGLSAMIGELWRRSGNLGLTAICSGCVFCHATSAWVYLFPGSSTVFPWGGTMGLFFALAWALVALAPDEIFGPLEPHSAPAPITDSQS